MNSAGPVIASARVRVAPSGRGRILVAVVVGFVASVVLAWTGRTLGAIKLPLSQVATVQGGTYIPQIKGVAAAATNHDLPVYPHLRLAWFVAIGALSLAFLYLGRRALRSPSAPTPFLLGITGLAWSLPLLFSAPLGSRDLWAYLGQGVVDSHHLDPYSVGPLAVQGPYLQQVSFGWADTPSPYGPLGVRLARLAADVAGDHVLAAAVALRVVAAVFFAAMVAVTPALCRRFGARPEIGLWLVAVSPLMVVVGVGGGHNDLIALGLMALGIWVATNNGGPLRTLAPGAVLVALGAEVKAPAAIVLAFLPFVWLTYAPGAATRRAPVHARIAAILWAAVPAIVTIAVVQLATGLGVGWVRRVNSVVSGSAALSVPKALTLIAKYVRGDRHGLSTVSPHTAPLLGLLAGVVVAVTLVILWLAACAGGDALRLLAVGLTVALVFSTNVEPWYFCWIVFVVALARPSRWASVALGAIGVILTVTLQPAGTSVLSLPVGLGICVFVAAVTAMIATVHRHQLRSATTQLLGPRARGRSLLGAQGQGS